MASRTASAFATGRYGGQAEPRRLEWNTKAGQLSVADIEPDPHGGYKKTLAPLSPGVEMVIGFHSVLHGYTEFAPKFQQQLQPWSPGLPVIPVPSDWANPVETIKLPLLVDRFGPLWLMLTATIAINAFKDLFDRVSWTKEAQDSLLPLVGLEPSRAVILRDRPGETYHAPAFAVKSWVSVQDAGLGPRITAVPTATLGHDLKPLHRLPTQPAALSEPRPLPEPSPQTEPASSSLPWESTSQPQPLPAAPLSAPVQSAAIAAASAVPSTDPFAIFRRQG
jgi:hypothetical protein